MFHIHLSVLIQILVPNLKNKMKNISIILLFCFLSVSGYGQFINNTQAGSATTLNSWKGGVQGDSALILPKNSFTDTTTANLSVASKYSGSLIMTSSGGYKVWYRTLLPNVWIQFATGTVPSQFNPIQGYGLLLTGSYPNITFTVDTTSGYLATWSLLKKKIDSLAATIPAQFNLSVNAPIAKSGTYPNIIVLADTGRAVSELVTGGSLNKVRDSLQANINLKLNISDTANMLLPYARIGNLADSNFWRNVSSNTITTKGAVQNLSLTGGVTAASFSASGTITAQNAIINNQLNVPNISAGTVSGTLQTAAQPLITSIGVLSNLTVTGNATINTIVTTAIIKSGGLSTQYWAADGTIQTSSASPFQELTAANITTVTPNANLSVTGNINAGTLSATSYIGKIFVNGTSAHSNYYIPVITSNTSGNYTPFVSSASPVLDGNNGNIEVIGNIIGDQGLKLNYKQVTNTYSITVTGDFFVDCIGSFTVTLPNGANVANRFIFIVKNSGSGVITIDASGPGFIDGQSSVTLSSQYSSYIFQGDGSNGWKITGAYTPTASVGSSSFTGTSNITTTTAGANLSITGGLSATLTTAAQPNITSLGPLSTLNVTGIGSFSGITVSGNIQTLNISATGTTRATAVIANQLTIDPTYPFNQDGNIILGLAPSGQISTMGSNTGTNRVTYDQSTSRLNVTNLAVSGVITSNGLSVSGVITAAGLTTSGGATISGNLSVFGNINTGNSLTLGFGAPANFYNTLGNSGATIVNQGASGLSAMVYGTGLTTTTHSMIGTLSTTQLNVSGLIQSSGLTVSGGITGTLATAAQPNITSAGLSSLTATNTTLTFSGSYNGNTARTVGLNLSNPNTWSGAQTFSSLLTVNASIAANTVFNAINTNSTGNGIFVQAGNGTGSSFQVNNYDNSLTPMNLLGNGNVTFLGTANMKNYFATSSAPSIVGVGTGLGTGGSASVVGTNMGGVITLSIGVGATNGNIANVTFSGSFAFPNGCSVIMQPSNGTAVGQISLSTVYGNGTTTGFSITDTGNALIGGTYTYNYIVSGY